MLCKINNVNSVRKGWRLAPLFCALMTQKINQPPFSWAPAGCLFS